MEKSFTEIFEEWSSNGEASEDEKELAQDFCAFLDSHFDKKLHQMLKEVADENTPEKVFRNNARTMMVQFHELRFKRDYRILYNVIIKSMKDYEFAQSGVRVPKDDEPEKEK